MHPLINTLKKTDFDMNSIYDSLPAGANVLDRSAILRRGVAAADTPRMADDLPKEAARFWAERVRPMIKSGKVRSKHAGELNRWCRLHAVLCSLEEMGRLRMTASERHNHDHLCASISTRFDSLSAFFGEPRL
tara:strand:+ start:704 stop:1102 length:399 start_codon:yes stop_codon:yes gene_type:complete